MCSTRTGARIDGASLVTAIITVDGRDVAVYGHDFTVRAGSMDATNGKKLARLFELAAKRHIPWSASTILPALTYRRSVASMATLTLSPRCTRSVASCPASCACLALMPVRQLPPASGASSSAQRHVFGLTGPGVVKSVLGEDITPDELGGPRCTVKPV